MDGLTMMNMINSQDSRSISQIESSPSLNSSPTSATTTAALSSSSSASPPSSSPRPYTSITHPSTARTSGTRRPRSPRSGGSSDSAEPPSHRVRRHSKSSSPAIAAMRSENEQDTDNPLPVTTSSSSAAAIGESQIQSRSRNTVGRSNASAPSRSSHHHSHSSAAAISETKSKRPQRYAYSEQDRRAALRSLFQHLDSACIALDARLKETRRSRATILQNATNLLVNCLGQHQAHRDRTARNLRDFSSSSDASSSSSRSYSFTFPQNSSPVHSQVVNQLNMSANPLMNTTQLASTYSAPIPSNGAVIFPTASSISFTVQPGALPAPVPSVAPPADNMSTSPSPLTIPARPSSAPVVSSSNSQTKPLGSGADPALTSSLHNSSLFPEVPSTTITHLHGSHYNNLDPSSSDNNRSLHLDGIRGTGMQLPFPPPKGPGSMHSLIDRPSSSASMASQSSSTATALQSDSSAALMDGLAPHKQGHRRLRSDDSLVSVLDEPAVHHHSHRHHHGHRYHQHTPSHAPPPYVSPPQASGHLDSLPSNRSSTHKRDRATSMDPPLQAPLVDVGISPPSKPAAWPTSLPDPTNPMVPVSMSSYWSAASDRELQQQAASMGFMIPRPNTLAPPVRPSAAPPPAVPQASALHPAVLQALQAQLAGSNWQDAYLHALHGANPLGMEHLVGVNAGTTPLSQAAVASSQPAYKMDYMPLSPSRTASQYLYSMHLQAPSKPPAPLHSDLTSRPSMFPPQPPGAPQRWLAVSDTLSLNSGMDPSMAYAPTPPFAQQPVDGVPNWMRVALPSFSYAAQPPSAMSTNTSAASIEYGTLPPHPLLSAEQSQFLSRVVSTIDGDTCSSSHLAQQGPLCNGGSDGARADHVDGSLSEVERTFRHPSQEF